MNRRIGFLLISFLFTTGVFAQEKHAAFWSDIQAFKKKDSADFPKSKQILLIGSSSFTMWSDVQDYFPGYPIINRGFGGSTLRDQIRYVNDIVFPYRPRQILIYCGENDFAESDTVSVTTVVNRFTQLFSLIRERDKKVAIYFVSMKPSPSRRHLMPKFAEANRLIKDFLTKQKNTGYIDVYNKMLKPDGEPMDDIFREDKLHMIPKGYAIWKKVIEPYLIK